MKGQLSKRMQGQKPKFKYRLQEGRERIKVWSLESRVEFTGNETGTNPDP